MNQSLIAQIGSNCGPFLLEEPLGQGGMGQVFLASRTDGLRQRVAVKTLYSWDEERISLFLKESKILAGLQHPHIAHLIDAGRLATGQAWFAMEYVQGKSLDLYLRDNALSIPDRLRLFQKICAALAYAHQCLVIHRDIKPGNVLVTEEGEPKLLDFGIAGLLEVEGGMQRAATVDLSEFMTPNYASPEQLLGLRLSSASDIYSLGVLLFQMLSGERPYSLGPQNPARSAELLEQLCLSLPSKVDGLDANHRSILRGDLDAIVGKAMAFECSMRYQSVEELASDVQRFLAHQPIQARSATTSYVVRKYLERNAWPVFASCLTVVFLVIFTAYAALQKERIEEQHRQAIVERDSAERISHFLVSLFDRADPQFILHGKATVQQLLDSGRKQLNASGSSDPSLRLNLLPIMGRIYRALGEFETSEALLEEAVSQLGTGPKSIMTRLELLRTLQQKGDFRVLDQYLERIAEDPLAMQRPWQTKIVLAQGVCRYLQGNFRVAKEALEAVTSQADDLTLEERYHFITHQAKLDNALGDYWASARRLEQLLVNQQTMLGDVHSNVAETLGLLSEQYIAIGEFDKAEDALKNSRDIFEKLFDEGHPHLIESLKRSASIRQRQGAYADAQALLEEALRQSQPRYPDLTNNLQTDLSILFIWSGDYGEAERYCRQSLGARLAQVGRNHPKTAQSLVVLGLIKNYQGQYDESELLYQRAIDAYRTIYGGRHPYLAICLNNLGKLKEDRGLLDEALSLQRESLEMRIDLLGWVHPEVFDATLNVGDLLERMGKMDEAEQVLEKAAILQKKLPLSIRQQISLQHALAMLSRGRGRYPEAVQQLNESLDLASQTWPDSHPWISTILNSMGVVYQESEQYVAASEAYSKSLKLQIDRFGEDSPSLDLAYYNLALSKNGMGRYSEALRLLQKARSLSQQTSDANTAMVSMCEHVMAVVYTHMGRYDAAADLLQNALPKLRQSFGPEHWHSLSASISLAYLELQKGNLKTAEKIYITIEPGLAHLETHLDLRILAALDKARIRRLSEQEGALELLDDAMHSTSEISGLTHAALLQERAAILTTQGRLVEALGFLENAISVREELLPKNHPLMAESLMRQSEILLGLGCYSEGRKVAMSALERFNETLPLDHEHLWITRSLLGALHYESGARSEGLRFMREAYVYLAARLGNQHPETLAAAFRMPEPPQMDATPQR